MVFVATVGFTFRDANSSVEWLPRPWSSAVTSCRLGLAFSLSLTPIKLEIALPKEHCSGGLLEAFWSSGTALYFLYDLQTSRPESLQWRRRENWRSRRSRIRR